MNTTNYANCDDTVELIIFQVILVSLEKTGVCCFAIEQWTHPVLRWLPLHHPEHGRKILALRWRSCPRAGTPVWSSEHRPPHPLRGVVPTPRFHLTREVWGWGHSRLTLETDLSSTFLGKNWTLASKKCLQSILDYPWLHSCQWRDIYLILGFAKWGTKCQFKVWIFTVILSW